MNFIDQKFYRFVRMLHQLNEETIYQNIKQSFQNLTEPLQHAHEDYFQKFSYWGKLDAKKNIWEHIELRAKVLKEHLDNFYHLYQKLQDYRSKQLLFAILNNWYQFDFQTLKSSIETNYLPYFDLDLIPESKNEVLVDLGAYTGDTILDYWQSYGDANYQKIYAYEITEESYQALRHTTKYYPNIIRRKRAVSDTKTTLYIDENKEGQSANKLSEQGEKSIETVTLDDDIKEPITMLKMDIEGSEQKALLGAKKHIQKDTPTLMISVYHSFEDMWKIPQMIDEIKPGYRFYLRNHGGHIFPTEITLIAIYPKENT